MTSVAQSFILLTLLLLCYHAAALEILAIISMPLKSHYMAFRSFFRELAVRGHNVTVINNYPDEEPHLNLRFINLHHEHKYDNTMEKFESIHNSYAHLRNVYRHLVVGDYVKENCDRLLTNDEVRADLTSNRKYHVIFVEQFMSDCGLAYALHFYDAPIIGITSHTLLPFSYPRMGLPFDIAADAFYFSKAGRNPSLLQKVENAIVHFTFNTVGLWNVQRFIYNSFDELVPGHSLNVEKGARSKMKMVFAYQHFSVTGARPLAPQLLEIGGIHVGVPKAVPQEIETFLADAMHGAIYVNFGTNLKPSTMSQLKRDEFLKAFKRLPYKVIWKYENATFKQDNLLTANWFPQLDILCHPKVLGFVSHGGMLSLSESTHCGKPLLTIPFFGDQFSNAAALRDVGMGKTLFIDTLNADHLEEAIRELTTTEMQQNARRVSKLWHDRPMPVMDSAIYWTEYVARHNSAPAALPAKHNTWFETLLVDVTVTILALVILLVAILYSVFKLIILILVKFFSLCRFRKKTKRE